MTFTVETNLIVCENRSVDMGIMPKSNENLKTSEFPDACAFS